MPPLRRTKVHTAHGSPHARRWRPVPAGEDLKSRRPPRQSDGLPPVPHVPGQWPVPYYSGKASTQQGLMQL